MKKLLLLGGCLWALAAQPARAQSHPDVVVLKVLESQLATRIVIARGWGFPEELNVTAGLTGNEATVAQESAKKIQQVLTKLYEQGYAIKSTFGGSAGGSSTLVLVKE